LEDRSLQDSASQSDGKLSADLVATLTPHKQELLTHLRGWLQLVRGVTLGEHPEFREVLSEWKKHCHDSSRMSDTQKTLSFSQPHFRLLDALDRFIITNLAITGLTSLLHSGPGATLSNTVEMNLATCPGTAILTYIALGFHLEIPSIQAFIYSDKE
jgi:hypothetical protein